MAKKDVATNNTELTKTSVSDYIIAAVLFIFCLTCIVPFVHIIAKSLSSNTAVLSKSVYLWPVGANFATYIRVFTSDIMMKQMGFTVLLTIAQTLLSLTVVSLCAYPLSRRYLPGRTIITFFVMVTMYFSAGLIPTYLWLHGIGMLNTVWVLLLPGAFSAYNMLIMRTYFMQSVPESLEESAVIDGAGQFYIFLRIFIPLSKPVFATQALWIAVGRWNGYADAMYYTTKRSLQPLQYLLYNMILSATPSESLSGESVVGLPPSAPEALQAATIMFATVPILIIYPFLQKYFVKGVMLGAVKG